MFSAMTPDRRREIVGIKKNERITKIAARPQRQHSIAALQSMLRNAWKSYNLHLDDPFYRRYYRGQISAYKAAICLVLELQPLDERNARQSADSQKS